MSIHAETAYYTQLVETFEVKIIDCSENPIEIEDHLAWSAGAFTEVTEVWEYRFSSSGVINDEKRKLKWGELKDLNYPVCLIDVYYTPICQFIDTDGNDLSSTLCPILFSYVVATRTIEIIDQPTNE